MFDLEKEENLKIVKDPRNLPGVPAILGIYAIHDRGVESDVYLKTGVLHHEWELKATVDSVAGSSDAGGKLRELQFSSVNRASQDEAIRSYLALQTVVQNDDGGWNFADNMDSETVRKTDDVSFANQFGEVPQSILEAAEIGVVDAAAMNAAKITLDGFITRDIGVPYTATDRMYANDYTSLLTAGLGQSLPFLSYYNLGLKGVTIEIDFYKAIEVWHLDGNPANPNPPTAAIQTIVDTRPLEVDAISMSDAARRLTDRLDWGRAPIPNIKLYDVGTRIQAFGLIKDVVYDTEPMQNYIDAIAAIVKDEWYPALLLNLADDYTVLGVAHSVRIFKRLEADAGFPAVLATSIDTLKGLKIATGFATGYYATAADVDNIATYTSGTKDEQGVTIQAFVATGENKEASALVRLLLKNQSSSGQFLDPYDLAGPDETYYSEGASVSTRGIIAAIKAGIIS